MIRRPNEMQTPDDIATADGFNLSSIMTFAHDIRHWCKLSMADAMREAWARAHDRRSSQRKLAEHFANAAQPAALDHDHGHARYEHQCRLRSFAATPRGRRLVALGHDLTNHI